MTVKKYIAPAIAWLKVTDYMHGWIMYKLGGSAMVNDQRVVCIQHLPGAREVLRMETAVDTTARSAVVNTMSATRRNCIDAGLDLDEPVVQQMFGLTREQLKLFIPIECPEMCLNSHGALRPWTLDVCFGREQAIALQRLLRNEFWLAVEKYNAEYSKNRCGEKYPAEQMIEEFCTKTRTPDLHVFAIRREWQRRIKRKNSQI